MDYTLGTVESHFADIVWSNEPISTGELIKICASELNWKRTTTYTVLKKLSERGIFQMKDGIVTSQVSRTDYYATQSEKFVAETLNGSLPAFIASFTKRKALSAKEVAENRQMIDAYGKEE